MKVESELHDAASSTCDADCEACIAALASDSNGKCRRFRRRWRCHMLILDEVLELLEQMRGSSRPPRHAGTRASVARVHRGQLRRGGGATSVLVLLY